LVLIKKILIVFIILAMSGLFGLTFLARRAPMLLKNSFERALNSEVSIRSVEYHFPWEFELAGFEVLETREPFRGDALLSVDRLTLQISPLSFSKKKLVIQRMEAEGARLVLRNWYGRIFHPFRDALRRGTDGESRLPDRLPESPAQSIPMALEIQDLKLKDSQFQYLDYDVRENGFVVTFTGLQGEIRNLMLPASGRKTSFSLEAVLSQGRDQAGAQTSMSGWVQWLKQDAQIALTLKRLHLPYFRPYYRKITQSVVAEGYLDVKSMLRIENKRLVADLGLEFNNLHFESYEMDGLLFNLKAEEILSFLKDSSGKLKLQTPVRWDLANRSIRFSQVMRKGIEQSLKKTLLGNFSHVIESAILKGGDKNLSSLFKS
jgi:hypothetical protein